MRASLPVRQSQSKAPRGKSGGRPAVAVCDHRQFTEIHGRARSLVRLGVCRLGALQRRQLRARRSVPVQSCWNPGIDHPVTAAPGEDQDLRFGGHLSRLRQAPRTPFALILVPRQQHILGMVGGAQPRDQPHQVRFSHRRATARRAAFATADVEKYRASRAGHGRVRVVPDLHQPAVGEVPRGAFSSCRTRRADRLDSGW